MSRHFELRAAILSYVMPVEIILTAVLPDRLKYNINFFVLPDDATVGKIYKECLYYCINIVILFILKVIRRQSLCETEIVCKTQ